MACGVPVGWVGGRRIERLMAGANPIPQPDPERREWVAKPAKNESESSSAGLPSHTQGQEGFLILKCPSRLSDKQAERLREEAERFALPMGLKVLIVADGMDATVVPAGMSELVQEMRAQSAAINRLAASNEMLVQAMAEEQGMDEPEPTTYLSGRPR